MAERGNVLSSSHQDMNREWRTIFVAGRSIPSPSADYHAYIFAIVYFDWVRKRYRRAIAAGRLLERR